MGLTEAAQSCEAREGRAGKDFPPRLSRSSRPLTAEFQYHFHFFERKSERIRNIRRIFTEFLFKG